MSHSTLLEHKIDKYAAVHHNFEWHHNEGKVFLHHIVALDGGRHHQYCKP